MFQVEKLSPLWEQTSLVWARIVSQRAVEGPTEWGENVNELGGMSRGGDEECQRFVGGIFVPTGFLPPIIFIT